MGAPVTAARRAALHVVLPLAAGVLAYVLFRRSDIRLFGWLSAAGLDTVVADLRVLGKAIRPHVPVTLRGSFADGAWAYAFGAALTLVWRERATRARYAWLLAGFAVTVVIEAGQGLRVVPGVFDAADFIAMVAGYLLGALAAGGYTWLRRPKASPSAPLPDPLDSAPVPVELCPERR
jgi:Na+/proline symporter